MGLAAGDKLGPYEILAPIGAGGMGEVWRGRDTRLGRDVAIKFSQEKFTERFGREARAIASLNHPNICTLYDVGPNYLVMEYVEGSPLRGPLPLHEALRLGLQIADAIEAAHRKGIIHRDLKPANVLITEFGPKLLDFGLAKFAERPLDDETATQTQEGTLLGTAAYMSPEQAQGRPVDIRSDIFSFGALLYEVVSGRRAFSGDSMVSILASILRDEPAPLDASEIQSITARCFRKQPGDRFQTAGELKTALEQALRLLKDVERSSSIAVLPFANLSADKDNEYFSDGLAEEILNGLTQVHGLRVIARASAFAFRGREHAIAEIAEKLRVACVLHGSVRKAGDRIRVTAQLINVADESQLWSERYDRELHDVFDIQDEIAQAIVAKLKLKLESKAGRPLVKRYTENLEAHSLYLKGNFHLYRLTDEDMEKGRQYLEQAVKIEPAHAPAWVQIADYYIAAAFFCQTAPANLWPKAMEAARRAVSADPELAEGHAVLGWAEALSEYRWNDSQRRLDTARQLNPASARTHFWQGCMFNAVGRRDEALAEFQRAADLDPLSTLFAEGTAIRLVFAGQCEQAIERARHVLEINPGSGTGMAVLGEAYSHLGRHVEAITLLEEASKRMAGGYYPFGFLAWAYVRAGRRSEAERFLAALEERRRQRYVSPGTIALVSLALGNSEQAYKWAATAVSEHDPNLPWIIRSPYFRPLQGSPRYQDILRLMNLAG